MVIKLGAKLQFFISLLIALACFFVLSNKVHAAPATFTVTNTNDSGAGSLRQAITDANANTNPSDMDLIEFDIPGGGAQVISLASELPIVTQKVTLDGSTQSGASCSPRSIMVRIDGTGLSNTNGFVLQPGADGSIVKGFAITNFSFVGVRIVDVDDIEVVCNNIGLQEDGITAGSNTEGGIVVFEDSDGTVIGGTSEADRNVLSNNATGVHLAGNGNTVNSRIEGNYIGTDESGTIANPNTYCGVSVGGTTSYTTIGGLAVGAGNLISGNADHGICAGQNSTYTTIQGNVIGLSAHGTSALPNNDVGLLINDASTNVTVGGTTTTARNIISGNGAQGIGIYGSSTDVSIQGNYIGTNASGDAALGNGANGIEAYDDANGIVIGGALSAERNIISANTGGAIAMNVDNAEIYGNYIGLGADGTTSLPNSFGAIGLIGGTGNRIGSSLPGQRNVISGLDGLPLVVIAGVSGGDNRIQGNYIGTDANGQVDESVLKGPGIAIAGNQVGNLIGGTNPGEGNLIAGVRGAGVAVESAVLDALSLSVSPAKNAILGNSIAAVEPYAFLNLNFANQAIDLGGFTDASDPPDGLPDSSFDGGPNLNDAGDGDTGANGYINTPELKTAVQNGNQLTITYDLDAADSPSNSYRVEFFANDQASIFGTGPGETYLGADSNVTPGQDKTVTLTVNDDLYKKALSATTTAEDNTTSSGFGGTSEFSQNIGIGNSVDLEADGVLDSVEDRAPNNGDGNNDGTPDKNQPTVTSYEIDSTGIYATLATTGCSSNGTVASIDASTLSKADSGKTYPYGLTDFTLNCSLGDTVNVTKYVFVPDQPSAYSLRKFNPNTEVYTDVTGSTITSQTVGATQALVSTYSITDGGTYDDDAEANGIIVDPVGLATETSNTTDTNNTVGAPNTGFQRHWLTNLNNREL